jgi:hypothetical protein
MIRGFNTARNVQAWAAFTTPYEHITRGLEAGADFIRIGVAKTPWDNDSPTTYGYGYRSHLKYIVDLCREAGAEVMVSAFSYGSWSDMSLALRGELMTDPNMQNAWIATFKQVINILQPDYIEMMNEPPPARRTNTGMTDAQLFARYHNFMEESAAAYLGLGTGVTIAVQSQPFWDMRPIAANPLSVPAVYTFHEYCIPQKTNVPIQEALAAGKVATAARLWEDNIRLSDMQGRLPKTGVGVQSLLNAGLPTLCTECGSTLPTPNRREWMQIHYDLMEDLGIGYSQHSINTNAGGSHNFGMLKSDGTFNDIGAHWAEQFGVVPPPPPPPLPPPGPPMMEVDLTLLSKILVLGGVISFVKKAGEE